MSARYQRLREELRVKILPLMTADIIEAVLVARELPPAQVTFLVTALLKETPPWGGMDYDLAGEIMLEEAAKASSPDL
jgi:hypothetical protein